MGSYTTIKNQAALRVLSRLIPLKHKLNFLVRNYLSDRSELAIRYFKNYFICISVDDGNRSTVEDVILRGVEGQPEEALVKRMRNELPDHMRFIDVGGNIGTFLWQFVDKCDEVFVFEPIPRLNQVIRNSITYNKENKVTVLPKAVGDQVSVVKMLDNNNSSIVVDVGPGAVIDIEVTTLDLEFKGVGQIDLVKIDVEGYEVAVLNGAIELIEKHRPVMLVEVHPGYLQNYKQSHLDVIRFFEERKYKIGYYSFLEELRMPRWERIISRWRGNPGKRFDSKEEFIKDIQKEPALSSYHFYCEPA